MLRFFSELIFYFNRIHNITMDSVKETIWE